MSTDGPANKDGARNSPHSPSNLELVKRMARFIGPVRRTALIACVLVAMWDLVDVSAIRLTGQITTRIQEALQTTGDLGEETFWQALHRPPLNGIVQMVMNLGVLVIFGGLIRFGREFINTK